MLGLFESINALSAASDLAIWASLTGYALQTISKFPSTDVATKIGQSIINEEARRDLVLEMLKFLFISYTFSSTIRYFLIRWDIHTNRSGVIIKGFELLTLIFNAFLMRIFLQELGQSQVFSLCFYLWRFFPKTLKPLLLGNTFCDTLIAPLEGIYSLFNDCLEQVVEFLLPVWKIFVGVALVFKPLLLLGHYGILGVFFLSFLFIEPAVLFSEILASVGNFSVNSEIMMSRISMFVALIVSAAVGLLSFTALYNCTIFGLGYVLPSEVGLCIWLLVGFSCGLGVIKIFTQIPEKEGYLWTLPQFSCLLVYQTSTVLGICKIASQTGTLSLFDHWNQNTRIGVLSGFNLALRLISQFILISSIVLTHIYAYYPELIEKLSFWMYPVAPEVDEIPEEVTVSFFLLNMFKGFWIFSKPIFVGLIYIYISPRSGRVLSLIHDIFTYPSWLVLASFFANLASSSLMCIYFIFVHDPATAQEDLETERFLQKINNGAF